MKNIQILGTGCSKCEKTMERVSSVAQKNNWDVSIEKVEDLKTIVSYGVMRTPAVVIDGKVVHKGSVPKEKDIEGWLK